MEAAQNFRAKFLERQHFVGKAGVAHGPGHAPYHAGGLVLNQHLPAPLLVKYFKRNGSAWEFDPVLRKKVIFKELNLMHSWPFMPAMDVVFLRNVLIYFDVETKKTILGKIRRMLRPNGYLFLGGAETTMNLDEDFERVVFDKATCYRNPGP